MKTYLFLAGFIGILTMVSPPALAGGPGRNDHDTASAALFLQPNQSGIIQIDHNDSWDNGSRAPWPYQYQPFPFPGSSWYGNGYYDTPYWGYQYGNNYYYNNYKPKRLTERQVVRAVKNQRFHHIDKVWFDKSDSVYKVRAVDYYGRRVLLLVDPYSGRILRWSFRR